MTPAPTDWIDVAGWTLVHFLWQGTVIALAAAGALRVLRAASSQARYAVACAALAAMLVAPIVTARSISRDQPAPPREIFVLSQSPAGSHEAVVVPFRTAIPPPDGSGLSAEGVRATVDRFLPIAVTGWLTGVALLLVRLVGGWWRVRRLHDASLAMPASRWQGVADRVASRLSVRKAVHVVDSMLVATPTVLGWLRPVVLLPIAALVNLTPSQVEAILAHELAHIRRHDYLINLLQTVVETLLFYHPGVWWVSSRIRAEREHCCDDVALEVCRDAVGYAAALAELETSRTGRPVPTGEAALALAATGGSLLERVRRVLGVHVDAGDRAERPALAGLVTSVLVLLFVMAAVGLEREPTLQASTGARPAMAMAVPSFDSPLGPELFFRHRGSLQVRQRVIVRVRQSATPIPSSTAVTGTIADPTGRGIPEAVVVLTDIAAAPDRSVRTDQSGRFEFVGLPIGQYLVGVNAPGLEPFHDRLTVFPGAKVQLDVMLQIRSLSIGFGVGRPAPASGTAGPRPLPAGWICLDDSGPLVRTLPADGSAFCGPPSLVQEFARDRDAARDALRKQGAQPSALLARAPVDYPQELWDALIEGTVMIEGRIGTDGAPVDLTSVAPVHPGLAKAALDAVRQWRFQPARLHDMAVESPLKVTMNFRLHQ